MLDAMLVLTYAKSCHEVVLSFSKKAETVFCSLKIDEFTFVTWQPRDLKAVTLIFFPH